MIADNTGFSTGPHTHMGLYRLNDAYMKVDTNEATGSIDPPLFFANKFAIDQATLSTLVKSNYIYKLGFSG
jgi:murein DD-endopeptidase MepM/ murein hydrolase activator NlpD